MAIWDVFSAPDIDQEGIERERALSMQARAQQQQTAEMMRQQALGRGPSIAQQQLLSGQEQAIKGAMATAAASRGGNVALAGRTAQQQQAAISQQAAGQAAQMRAQEMLAARGQLAQTEQGIRQQDLGQQQMASQQAMAEMQAEGQHKGAMLGGAAALVGGAAALSDVRAKEGRRPVSGRQIASILGSGLGAAGAGMRGQQYRAPALPEDEETPGKAEEAEDVWAALREREAGPPGRSSGYIRGGVWVSPEERERRLGALGRPPSDELPPGRYTIGGAEERARAAARQAKEADIEEFTTGPASAAEARRWRERMAAPMPFDVRRPGPSLAESERRDLAAYGAAPGGRFGRFAAPVPSDRALKVPTARYPDVREALEPVVLERYRYREPEAVGARSGEYLGPSAQALARSPEPGIRKLVLPTRQGLAIDGGRAGTVALGVAAEQQRQIEELEEQLAALREAGPSEEMRRSVRRGE